MAISASLYSSVLLNSMATASATLYQRQTVNKLDATTSNAIDLGLLTYNKTHLSAVGGVMQENTTNVYKFTLDGTEIKASFDNLTNSSDLRMQLLDSSGSVVADNEGTADQIAAYEELTSSDGLKTEAGDYYVKVSFGSVALKSKAQNYNVSLYSGTVFSSSYQTTASSQTKTGQRVLVDETLTFAASDARKYGKETILPLNTSIDSPTNIGWLYENRGALSLKSKLSPMSSEAYYNFVLQKGDSLKMSFNNRTGTSDLRVQLLDPTGTRVYADSDGTEEQKEAYEALTSSTGLSAKTGSYIVKVTYAKTADRTKEQAYDVKLYSGEHYTSLYETTAAVEDYETAVLNGHWEAKYSPETAVASYLQSALQGDGVDIMETIKSTV